MNVLYSVVPEHTSSTGWCWTMMRVSKQISSAAAVAVSTEASATRSARLREMPFIMVFRARGISLCVLAVSKDANGVIVLAGRLLRYFKRKTPTYQAIPLWTFALIRGLHCCNWFVTCLLLDCLFGVSRTRDES